MTKLPADLLTDGVRAVWRAQTSCLGGIRGSAESVRTHMGNARGLSGGSGGGRGCGSLRVTSGARAEESTPDLFTRTKLAISESSRPSDCATGAAILGSFRLEQPEHPLRTVRCPPRDDPPVGFAE